ncbi:MAG: copper amine oxidase N-terminal domain-containing protein [Bacillota bacterium]|nr:copper amine oxidase N-terminal domain-containing protein [Bacillota bacterium]
MKVLGRRALMTALVLAMVLACGALAFADEAGNEYGVMIDGEYVTFTDAAPQNVEGRIMVPFRAIFESLGAEVEYAAETRTVTAALGAKTISFDVGGSEILIEEDGASQTRAMDVVPFIDEASDRTYVPTRFIAEALGFVVGWDAEAKTAVVIDPAMFDGLNEELGILSLMFQQNTDMEQVYAGQGSITLEGQMDMNQLAILQLGQAAEEDQGSISISMDGSISGMQQGNNADLDLVMPLVMSVTAEGQTIDTEMDLSMKTKLDGETMTLYLQCPLYAQMGMLEEGAWLKMDMQAFYEDMGMDVTQLMELAGSGADLEVEALLAEMLSLYADSFTVSTYQEIQSLTEVLVDCLGDEAFVQTSSGGYTVYTAEFESPSVEGVALDGSLVIRARGEVFADFDLEMNLSMEDSFNVALQARGSALTAEMSFSVIEGDAVNFVMEMSLELEEAEGTVEYQIPADAQVVDYMEWMESMLTEE